MLPWAFGIGAFSGFDAPDTSPSMAVGAGTGLAWAPLADEPWALAFGATIDIRPVTLGVVGAPDGAIGGTLRGQLVGGRVGQLGLRAGASTEGVGAGVVGAVGRGVRLVVDVGVAARDREARGELRAGLRAALPDATRLALTGQVRVADGLVAALGGVEVYPTRALTVGVEGGPDGVVARVVARAGTRRQGPRGCTWPVPEDDGERVSLRRDTLEPRGWIAFEAGGVALAPQGRDGVIDVAEALRGDYAAYDVVVELDRSGRELALAEARAEHVALALFGLGVDAGRISWMARVDGSDSSDDWGPGLTFRLVGRTEVHPLVSPE